MKRPSTVAGIHFRYPHPSSAMGEDLVPGNGTGRIADRKLALTDPVSLQRRKHKLPLLATVLPVNLNRCPFRQREFHDAFIVGNQFLRQARRSHRQENWKHEQARKCLAVADHSKVLRHWHRHGCRSIVFLVSCRQDREVASPRDELSGLLGEAAEFSQFGNLRLGQPQAGQTHSTSTSRSPPPAPGRASVPVLDNARSYTWGPPCSRTRRPPGV